MRQINLEPHEMQLACMVAIQRQIENIVKKTQPAYGAGRRNDWQIMIEGCLGEMALSKMLGVYWDGKGQYGACDVGDVDCRTSPNHEQDLILHKRDPGDRFFCLITGARGEYVYRGGIFAREGKLEKYWGDKYNNGRPAFWVPQEQLRSAP